MRVQLIAKSNPGVSGTSRYTENLRDGLLEAGVIANLTFPSPIFSTGWAARELKKRGLDLQAFFSSYPLRVPVDETDVYHITTQTMASLLVFQRFPSPVVVTVLDIIPYLVRGDPTLDTSQHVINRLFYRLSLLGLRRADSLIAISNYTRESLITELGIPPNRIQVVYPAIDQEIFKPLMVPDEFWEKYALSKLCRYILYVGSDDPRKNLETLVRAFVCVKKQFPDTKLLLVGPSQFPQARQGLESLINQMEHKHDIHFFEAVPDQDLAIFYNVADVFVMPSFYEGFGLPVIEAMACETPVVCADTTALPEVVGEAALLFDPGRTDDLVSALCEILEDKTLAERLNIAGKNRAALFKSRDLARQVADVYVCSLHQTTYCQ